MALKKFRVSYDIFFFGELSCNSAFAFLDVFYRHRPRRFLKPSHRRTTRSRGKK